MTTFAELLQTCFREVEIEQIAAQDDNMYIEAARAQCPNCYENDKAEGQPFCAECLRDNARGYQARSLAGRCSNGMELDHGKLYHAVIADDRAMCGAKPGRRSVGWSSYRVDAVTCPRCLKKLAKRKAA